MLVLAAALFACFPESAATQVAAPPAPSCSEDLAGARRAIEANYGGFRLEIVGPRRQEFERVYAKLQLQAHRSGGDCYPVLDAFAAWFADPHVFIYQTVRLDSVESARRAQAVRMAPITEVDAREYFRSRAGRLDPIEGIWYSGPLRVAVVPDSSMPRGHFLAVVLQPDTSIWRAGSVRATIVRGRAGGYEMELSGPNYVAWHRRAHLHKDVLLRLDPGMWGKAFPAPAADSGLLDSIEPHRPTLLTRAGAVIISMPSHDPTYKPALDSLVAANAELLRTTDLLILDLRGNEGGASFASGALAPYLVNRERRPSPMPPRHAVMLASPDQITYAKVAFGPDTSAFVRSLVSRMQSHPHEFVPLDTASSNDDEMPDSIIYGPRRVGVMIDRGTVSASEVTVEAALKSTRATVFGLPTAGALDYEQVNIVSIDPNEHRWFLGYPTITRDLGLPRGGIRGKGLRPDVNVDWARVADPIDFVIRALRH
ncbi:MAG: S41 family peptidase [Gemmatimonadota bacterium]